MDLVHESKDGGPCTAFFLCGLVLMPAVAFGQCYLQNVQRTDVGSYLTVESSIQVVFDAAHHRTVLVVGAPAPFSLAPTVYTYDGSQWSLLSTIGDLPGDRVNFALCYDSTHGQVLLFGGTVYTPGFSAVTNDLYALRGSTWVQLSASGPPVTRSSAYFTRGQPSAFDPVRGRAIFVLPEGDTGQIYQTWEWTGTGWDQGPDFGPAYLDQIQQFIFDPFRNEGILIEIDSDTVWRYRPGATAAQGSWQMMNSRPTDINGNYYGRALVYDPFRHWMIQCFGRDRTGVSGSLYLAEERVWDPGALAWMPRPLGDFPTNWARAYPRAVYDTDRDRMVVVTGYANERVDGSRTDFTDTIEQSDLGAGILSSSSGSFSNCVGDTAVFSVTAVGDDIQYQWYKNGIALGGKTASLLVLTNVAAGDAGNYSVVVSNSCGYTPSPVSHLRVDPPIGILRPSVWPDCSLTCIGSNISIFPPAPSDGSLNVHLQEWISGAWVDLRVSTPSDPQNFVFNNIQKDFTGDYRFYIDGSACPGIVEQTHHFQVGFDITSQPQSLSGVRPCATVAYSVGTSGGCGLAYHWFKSPSQYLSDNGHFSGTQTPTLTIGAASYQDEGLYACLVVDTNQCFESLASQTASLKLVLPQWVLRTTNGPAARYANAMAYDSARAVTVMYGGGSVVAGVGYVGMGEIWEWNGARWRQRTTYNATSAWTQVAGGFWTPSYSNTPPARMEHAMAYDSKRGRVVMFGGRSANPGGSDTFFNDTWEWDGSRWFFRTTNGPPARIDHAMAYDSNRGIMVLYGGFPASPAQVWEWNGTNWTSVSPTNGPNTSYNQLASMDYDSAAQQALLGPTTDGFTTRFFWSWDGHDWHDRGSGFSLLHYAPLYGAMVFDTYRNRSWYFGGQNNGPSGFYGGSTAAYLDSSPAEFPASWSEVPDAAQTSSFTTTDFVDAAVFAARISAQAEPVSQYLWSQLSSATQQTLTNGISTSGQKATALAADLNLLISTTGIYDATRFGSVTFSTETILYRSLNPLGKDLVRFNRLVIEDAYPVDIVRSLSTPPGRMNLAMAFDSGRYANVVMGGRYDPSTSRLDGNDTWEMVYLDAPIINDQPASQYRAPGDTAVFSVNARAPYGSSLSYEWYFGAQPVADGGRISGAHSPTLRISNVNLSDTGPYRVRISDGCGSLDSAPAFLTTEARLQIFSIGNAGILVWAGENLALQQADALTGPWSTIPGAVSPFDVTFDVPARFFRLSTTAP